MRHERIGRMTESLYERRRANIKGMSAMLLATGVTLAWLALKGIAIAGPMSPIISGFVLIITLGVGYLCVWLWFLAVVKLGFAYCGRYCFLFGKFSGFSAQRRLAFWLTS